MKNKKETLGCCKSNNSEIIFNDKSFLIGDLTRFIPAEVVEQYALIKDGISDISEHFKNQIQAIMNESHIHNISKIKKAALDSIDQISNIVSFDSKLKIITLIIKDANETKRELKLKMEDIFAILVIYPQLTDCIITGYDNGVLSTDDVISLHNIFKNFDTVLDYKNREIKSLERIKDIIEVDNLSSLLGAKNITLS